MIVEFEKPLRVYPIIIGCNNAVDKHIMVCSKPYTISTLKKVQQTADDNPGFKCKENTYVKRCS